MLSLIKWIISNLPKTTSQAECRRSAVAGKKGSSLLMVVMTMSVIIVISSSFMMLSFNTGIGSIFASSQQKAQQSCLAVAESLKDGNVFGSLVTQYSGELSSDQVVNFEVNDPKLSGKTTVTLEPTTSGGSVKKVRVIVTTNVGGSKFEIKFTHTLTTDSVRDVINQVTNSMSVSGGGSFSMQTGKVEGDLSLDGDYLLALNTYKEINDKTDGQTGWVVYPGTVDGNVYCNGDLVIGYKGAEVQIWKEECIGSSDTYHTSAIPTIIKENLYVNGNLIINAAEIHGDVYVSGNVLINGRTDTRRGTETDQGSGRYYKNADNAIIKGNLYVGGSLYVPTNSFSRYFPQKEKVVGDSGNAINTEGYRFNGSFPTFPSAGQIYGTTSAGDYNNSLLNHYNKTITSKATNSNGEYVFTYNNGAKETLSKDFLNSGVGFSGKVWTPYKDSRTFNDGKDTSYSQYEQLGGKLGIVFCAYNAMRVKKDGNIGDKCYEEDTDWHARAYNVAFQMLTGNHWNDSSHKEGELSQESSKVADSSATLRTAVSKHYEKFKLTASYGNFNTGSDNFSEQTFTVSDKVYVQGDAFVQLSNKKLGAETHILGKLTSYSVTSICNGDGTPVTGVSTAFKKLYVGETISNYTFYTDWIIGSMENYYTANMALRGTDQDTSSLVQHVLKKTLGVQNKVCSEHKKEFKKGTTYAFYYGSGTFSSSGNYENHNQGQLNYSSYSTTFTLSSKESNYGSNQQLYMLFKSSNMGGSGSGSGTTGYTVVKGIMSFGSRAAWGKITNTVSGKEGNTSRATFDDLKLSEDEMYDEDFLKNHNSSPALRNEQKRAEEVEKVGDVLKEMGVWGYTPGEIATKSYQNAYQGGNDNNPMRYYYNNLAKTGSPKEYAAGDNKLNDRNGVNFTGVTAATQIKFGYTLQRAIYASEKGGIITVTSKGSIKHPSATSGDFFGNSDARDWRVLYKNKASYKNSPVGAQNIENLTKYFVYGAGNLGDTFYGRLVFLGAYDYNMFRSNNYSEIKRSKDKSERQAAFERDVKEVMRYLHDPSKAGADAAMWSQYGKEYAGVFGYDGSGNLCIYLMKDIYLGGDTYYGFGKDTASDDVDGAGFKLFLDTSYGSINVYWGSDANGMLNFDSDSYIEISIVDPQPGTFNVAYMYLLPNIACSHSPNNGYWIMNYWEKKQNISDIVNAQPEKDASGNILKDSDGQTIFKSSKTGKFYKYSVKSYAEANTGSSDKPLSSNDPSLNMKFTYIARMWDNCKIKNTAIKSGNTLKAAGIPFIMCEGPMLYMMGQKGEVSGIIYSPNPDSVFFCASSTAIGTAASDPSTTFDGGAIVTGRVIGTAGNNSTWKFFEDTSHYDIGELLTKALLEDPHGLGEIETSGGTNTSGNWTASDFE